MDQVACALESAGWGAVRDGGYGGVSVGIA
jgi:hypothetical protein